jgi:hypothetical protein
MSQKHSTKHRQYLPLSILSLGALAVISSFALGMKTAGDVQTVAPMEASGIRIAGDINNDGVVNTQDVIAILEVVRGYKQATPDQLQADPNADGSLTIDDAIRILNDLSIR